MSERMVFISGSRIRAAQRAVIGSAFEGALALSQATKPRTTLFAAYVDETATEMRVIHVFPDAAAMAVHFEGSAQRTTSASQLIQPAGFEIYGPAPARSVDQLRREAGLASAPLDLFLDPVGGYLRPPA